MADKETMPIQESPPIRPETGVEMPESPGGLEVPKPAETALEAPAVSIPATAPAPSVPQAKDETTVKVESVLEEGLAATYATLDPATKSKFRSEGERVTKEIVAMMRKAKVKARKILDLIRGWLKIIPGVNRHFLDQEAKIKTDRIMHLSDKEQDIL